MISRSTKCGEYYLIEAASDVMPEPSIHGLLVVSDVTSYEVLTPTLQTLWQEAKLGFSPLLWIEYVATAPWNFLKNERAEWDPMRAVPAGPPLVHYAILRSKSWGLNGAIGLHGEGGAGKWYEVDLKMRRVGVDQDRETPHPVYVGDSTWASQFPIQKGVSK